jgi:hypothetical protein
LTFAIDIPFSNQRRPLLSNPFRILREKLIGRGAWLLPLLYN